MLPATSDTPPFAMRGIKVPVPADVAETVNSVLDTEATDQVMPVAVPVFEISDAVNDPVVIGSLNVTVKLMGTELVKEPWLLLRTKDATAGATLS